MGENEIMKEFGRNMFLKGQSLFNGLKKDEKGSTAVEFMGIAAVVVIVVMLIMSFLNDGQGENWVTQIFNGLFDGVLGWIGKAFGR